MAQLMKDQATWEEKQAAQKEGQATRDQGAQEEAQVAKAEVQVQDQVHCNIFFRFPKPPFPEGSWDRCCTRTVFEFRELYLSQRPWGKYGVLSLFL